MLLTGNEISRQIDLGTIRIDPKPTVFGPNSVDVRLGHVLRVYEYASRRSVYNPLDGVTYSPIDLRAPPKLVDVPTIDGTNGPAWLLVPHRLYIGATVEWIEVDGYVPLLYGRSSFARGGVHAHLNAGFFDDGFRGVAVLELHAVEPVLVYPGDFYCQFAFAPLLGHRTPYTGRYQGQDGPVGTRGHEGESAWNRLRAVATEGG